MGALTNEETEDGIRLIADVLIGDSIPLRYGLLITARVGIDALDVFRLVFPRFEIMGLSERLEQLKREHDALSRRTLGEMDNLHSRALRETNS
jgi:hypothetical protein